MTVYLNDSPLAVANDTTLSAFVSRFSPYANEPVLVLLNGSAAAEDSCAFLNEGDRVSVYPRLIGG